MASRVGKDRLGLEALRRMRWKDMSDDLIQLDEERATGFVEVTLDDDGVPEYTIVQPVAWDEITLTDALLARVENARALVFGSLAQRSATSRDTVQRLYRSDTVTVFDVNLRPPFDSRTAVRDSLGHSDIVKLNIDELQQLSGWFGWAKGDSDEQIRDLMDQFDCETVCVTRGADGAVLAHEDQRFEHPGSSVDVVDTVGAGDAFLATLLAGILEGWPPRTVLARANRLGAYLAGCLGATPDYDPEAVLTSVTNGPNAS
jgi:fructokinase